MCCTSAEDVIHKNDQSRFLTQSIDPSLSRLKLCII